MNSDLYYAWPLCIGCGQDGPKIQIVREDHKPIRPRLQSPNLHLWRSAWRELGFLEIESPRPDSWL